MRTAIRSAISPSIAATPWAAPVAGNPHPQAHGQETTPHLQQGSPLLPLLIGIVVVAILCLMIIRLASRSSATTTLIPQERVGPKQVLLANYPDGRAWLDYYKLHENLLGDPQWSERPYDVWDACVGFTNYVVCHDPSPNVKGTVWAFLPLLLGTRSLPNGVRPDPGAPLAPIVQAYIAQMEAQGNSRLYWLGTVQGPALCPPAGGACVQVFQREDLSWPNGSTDPLAVHLSPLGLSIQLASS